MGYRQVSLDFHPIKDLPITTKSLYNYKKREETTKFLQQSRFYRKIREVESTLQSIEITERAVLKRKRKKVPSLQIR